MVELQAAVRLHAGVQRIKLGLQHLLNRYAAPCRSFLDAARLGRGHADSQPVIFLIEDEFDHRPDLHLVPGGGK